MKFAIRVDASISMGLGHLVRCRTLAEALCARGATVHFICRKHSGNQISALSAEGFMVTALPPPSSVSEASTSVGGDDYAQWVGVPQKLDAAETIAALAGNKISNGCQRTEGKGPESLPTARPNWLIVDHYGLDADWERALRSHVGRILVIDDLANRRHDCDVLFDQNYASDVDTRYQDRLPGYTQTLLGPRYALLRPEYVQHRQRLRLRDGGVRRVLVFFGGTDLENLTGRALEALADPALAYLAVDVVVGANNPHRDTLATLVAARAGTRLFQPRQHLADLMAGADLALGAGGTTTWERCCLGLPSLVVSIADNQRPACEALASDGLIHYAGHCDRMSTENLRDAITQLLQDPTRLRALSNAGSCAVDGAGTERVVRALMENT